MSGRYDSNEFETINYMSTSGSYGCQDSDDRQDYYGITGLPTLVWLGTEYMVGAGTDVVDGAPYDAVVRAHLGDATPFIIDVTESDFGLNPHVDFDVVLDDDVSGTYMVRAFLLEDGVGGTYDNVLRDMFVESALTISSAGQTQSFSQAFDITGLVAANLRVVMIVQDETTKEVMQTASTRSAGDYSFRFYSLGDRVVIDSGTHQYGDFVLFNTGNLTDTFYLDLDTANLPASWDAYLLDTDLNVHYSVAVDLAPGETAQYNLVIETGDPGGGDVDLEISSLNRTDPRSLSYSVITPDTEVLMVDDDGAFDYEDLYFGPALATTGRSFAIWDRGSTALSAAALSNFDVVVWATGFAFPTLDADDRAALGAYMDAGGSVFATGQDIGWELHDEGGAAYQWYHDYLHANFVADDTNRYDLSGVPGDLVSNGLDLYIAGGDGANNQQYPDAIAPYDGDAHVILTYDNTSWNGAIAADTGVYRLVYFGFGFEAIDNAADRAQTMSQVVNWLLYDPTGVDEGAPFVLSLNQNVPNPFNPKTEIAFSLGEAGEVSLQVFDVNGRLVTVLEDGFMEAGQHSVVWNGLDEQGHQATSGLYFYRLVKGDEVETRKMMLVK